jgi:capsular polysaccharide transport system permease protein
MTQPAQLKLEQRFSVFKASVSGEQWTDASFLLKKVEELETADIALAFRLMQRVKNLNPSDANQKKLADLQQRALQNRPELATSSSTESTISRNLIRHTRSLKAQIVEVIAHPKMAQFKQPFVIFVLLPFFIFSFYQVIIASPQYESQAMLIVKEPDGMATLDPAMAIMAGFGADVSNLDTELVKAFVYSNDMLGYLEKTLAISEHYSDRQYDFISRLDNEASRESILSYYLDKVLIELDANSQVLSIPEWLFR